MKVGVSWRGVSVGEGSAGEGGQWSGIRGEGGGGGAGIQKSIKRFEPKFLLFWIKT